MYRSAVSCLFSGFTTEVYVSVQVFRSTTWSKSRAPALVRRSAYEYSHVLLYVLYVHERCDVRPSVELSTVRITVTETKTNCTYLIISYVVQKTLLDRSRISLDPLDQLQVIHNVECSSLLMAAGSRRAVSRDRIIVHAPLDVFGGYPGENLDGEPSKRSR